MIILLQSVTAQFRSFFDILHIAKCGKAILLQSVTDCYYKVCQVLQSVMTLLQSPSVNTKCNVR